MRTMTALALAGILGLAACSTAVTSTGSVAPLNPTEDELYLLSGVRLDLQTACAPLRADLAQAALAGVECMPTSDVVDHLAIYVFNTQQELLDTYRARLATHGVQLRMNAGRGDGNQASEGGYVPGDAELGLVVERGGSYLDETGKAHYVATMPPFVLIELDGKVGDIAAVQRWAWLGNQDQPGAPTIWRSAGPASPEK